VAYHPSLPIPLSFSSSARNHHQQQQQQKGNSSNDNGEALHSAAARFLYATAAKAAKCAHLEELRGRDTAARANFRLAASLFAFLHLLVLGSPQQQQPMAAATTTTTTTHHSQTAFSHETDEQKLRGASALRALVGECERKCASLAVSHSLAQPGGDGGSAGGGQHGGPGRGGISRSSQELLPSELLRGFNPAISRSGGGAFLV
jgi:hypothetical protein